MMVPIWLENFTPKM